jgi:hypothetical protein
MLSNNLSFESELLNRGFVIVESLFRKNGWYPIKNEKNWVSYTKFGDETTSFDIKFLQDTIIVSIPIKNSPCQYSTTFNNYLDASEYIEKRFYDYN